MSRPPYPPDDPEWRAARDDYVEDVPGESAESALVRRILAIRRMHAIEEQAELALTPAGEVPPPAAEAG